jgi:hypothetical protein
MARIEFLNTTATRALGVEGRTLLAPLIPSVAAIAKTARYFEVAANELQPMERTVGILWESLTRAGAHPTIHQVAMLVDATGLDSEKRARFGGDFVIHVEPGDPGFKGEEKDDPSNEPEADPDLPTGRAAGELDARESQSTPDGTRFLPS